MAAWLLLGHGIAWAQKSPPADALQIKAEHFDDAVWLSAQLRVDLPPAVEDALRKGVSVVFVTEAWLSQERWYWADKRWTAQARYSRLTYQTLTRRWRLQQSSEPINNTGLGSGIGQTFDSLADAMRVVQRINQWKVADLPNWDPDGKYTVEFAFRLDATQLPRPFLVGPTGSSDWNVSINKTVRVTEPSK